MPIIRLAMVGMGNLGWRFCSILLKKDRYLQEKYGLYFRVVSAVDSRGAAYDPNGLDLHHIVKLKTTGQSVADYPRLGHHEVTAIDMMKQIEADVLLEASPVHLEQGAEPGLTCIRMAMHKGMHVVTPNKGPLVVAFDDLHALARENKVELKYDGTVAGGLPALNVGTRDLRGAYIKSIQAVPNLVTGYMMDLLSEGMSYDNAFERAKDEGILEGDGTWDLDGWDAAAKLTILTKAVMGLPAKITDVERLGIRDIPVNKLIEARNGGFLYRLLVRADRDENGALHLSAKPTALPSTHPLGCLGQKQMGVVYETDIYGTITLIINEENPVPSAATMLRDLLDIYTSPGAA